MKKILYKLFEHNTLDRDEAKAVMLRISNGEFNDSQLAAFTTVFLMRSISLDELSGFRDALLERRVEVDLSDYHAIDIVGTGGDNKNTFNISTATSFVVAGAGYQVVKHGNYGSSSVSGASDVMEVHGVRFTADIDKLKRSLERSGVAFLHAPLFNEALKGVAPVRKALGIRTFFNMLGPLVNPSIPRCQLLGVYNLKLARLYNYLYQNNDIDYSIVTSLDGYDEISLTADFKLFDRSGEKIISPAELGFRVAVEADLYGGETIKEAATIFDNVLSGTGTEAQTNAVVANAAYAIHTLDSALSIEQCIEKAVTSVKSGAAQERLQKFIALNR